MSKTKIVHSIIPKFPNYKKKGVKSYSLDIDEFNAISGMDTFQYITLEMKFKAPIISSFPWICFDGVISQYLLNLTLEETYYQLNTNKPFKSKVNHYAKSPILHKPIPSTSVIRWYDEKDNLLNPEFDITQHIITKKIHDEHSATIRTKTKYISKSSDSFLKYPVITAFKGVVQLYAKPSALEMLMPFVHGIGKKINMGNGSIHKYVIKKNEKHQAHYDFEEGISLRPIPIRLLETYDKSNIGIVAWKPPYWSKRRLEQCVTPFTKCTLKEDLFIE